MTYRLTIAVDPNVSMEIEQASMDSLCDEFGKLGGDPEWLRNTAKAAVTASLHGEASRVVVRSMGATVIESSTLTEDPFTSAEIAQQSAGPMATIAPTASPPLTGPTGPTPPTSGITAKDPWADEPEYRASETETDWPGEAAVVRTALTSARAPATDPWGSPEAVERPAQPSVTTTDTYGREWTIGHRDAPACECGEPAAMMRARAKESNNIYTKWRCAKAAGSDYRKKCDLDEFVQKR
jgi:hypothetical protein